MRYINKVIITYSGERFVLRGDEERMYLNIHRCMMNTSRIGGKSKIPNSLFWELVLPFSELVDHI